MAKRFPKEPTRYRVPGGADLVCQACGNDAFASRRTYSFTTLWYVNHALLTCTRCGGQHHFDWSRADLIPR